MSVWLRCARRNVCSAFSHLCVIRRHDTPAARHSRWAATTCRNESAACPTSAATAGSVRVRRAPSCAAMRLGKRKLTLLTKSIEQRARRVLRLLNVGFVERVDLEEQSRRRRRDFPAEELARQVPDSPDMSSSACGTSSVPGDRARARAALRPTARRRCDRREAWMSIVSPVIGTTPLPCLPGAFGDQLLDPQTEGLQVRRHPERELVAAGVGRPHPSARRARALDSRSRGRCRHACSMVRAPASRASTSRPMSAAGTMPKQRQRRIPAADVRRIDEYVTKSFGGRAPVQGRIRIGDGDESAAPVAVTLGDHASPGFLSHDVRLDRRSRTCSP